MRIYRAYTPHTKVVTQLLHRLLAELDPTAPARNVAADQLREVCAALRATTGLPVNVILRLRSNLVLYRAPGPSAGRGRPRQDGAPCTFRDADTGGAPDETVETAYPGVGAARLRVWHGRHVRGGGGPAIPAFPCHLGPSRAAGRWGQN